MEKRGNTKVKKTRTGTVCELVRCVKSALNGITCDPCIRIRGKWLEGFGFQRGERYRIKASKRRLVLTVIEIGEDLQDGDNLIEFPPPPTKTTTPYGNS